MKRRGFTLIEAVAALMLLEVVLWSVLNMFSFGSRSYLINEDRLIAYNLIQWKVEEIRCKPFSAVLSEGNTSFPNYPDYVFSVGVFVGDAGMLNLKRVDVRMDWTDAFGIARQEIVGFSVSNSDL